MALILRKVLKNKSKTRWTNLHKPKKKKKKKKKKEISGLHLETKTEYMDLIGKIVSGTSEMHILTQDFRFLQPHSA